MVTKDTKKMEVIVLRVPNFLKVRNS